MERLMEKNYVIYNRNNYNLGLGNHIDKDGDLDASMQPWIPATKDRVSVWELASTLVCPSIEIVLNIERLVFVEVVELAFVLLSVTHLVLSTNLILFPEFIIAFKTTGGIILGIEISWFFPRSDKNIAFVALDTEHAYFAPMYFKNFSSKSDTIFPWSECVKFDVSIT